MGRRHKQWTPDVVRQRIQTAQLINRLQGCALGEIDMTPAQLKSAEILLRKALPDLQSIEHTGEVAVSDVRELSREILLNIAAGGSVGAAPADGCSGDPAELH